MKTPAPVSTPEVKITWSEESRRDWVDNCRTEARANGRHSCSNEVQAGSVALEPGGRREGYEVQEDSTFTLPTQLAAFQLSLKRRIGRVRIKRGLQLGNRKCIRGNIQKVPEEAGHHRVT